MEDGDKWEIPPQFYPAIKQAAVIIKNSPNKPVANAFLSFLKSEEGRTLLSRYGLILIPPSSPGQAE
jgi:ABC-type molybdate transport system substrate-binding protein